MKYIMRTEKDGYAMWSVDAATAASFIKGTPGEWFQGTSGKLCYQVKTDGAWTIRQQGSEWNLYYFAGCYLVPQY